VSDATIRDKAAVVGIGQTPFAKSLGRSEYDMALEAILAACADAGIAPREIDGTVRYDMETTDEENLLAALGNPCLRYFVSSAWGGGGSATVVVLAAAAITAGLAHTVLVYRSRARGKQSAYGKTQHLGGRYWERLDTALPGLNSWHVPHGLVSAFQEMAMIAMRHRIEYGTTDDQYAEVAVAFRGHALRNPNAVMRRPMTIADHHASRLISDPLRLLDCCLETDGAAAVVVAAADLARDLRQKPAWIMAASQGMGPRNWTMNNFFKDPLLESPGAYAARDLWRMAGVSPKDVPVAQLYDAFTPLVLASLEEYGFCRPGEAGAFVEDHGLELGERLPTNTSGGSLSEAYVHGINLIIEAARQIRGTSLNQVPGAKLSLATSGNMVPTGALLLRGD
jgi:acetyl-CoA acetyltransferase